MLGPCYFFSFSGTHRRDCGSAAAQVTQVKAASDKDVNCRSEESNASNGLVQEDPVAQPHSEGKNGFDSICSDKGFLPEWDGAA